MNTLPPVTLFIHVPKTAGTTMRQVLYSQYSGKNALLHLHRVPEAEAAAQLKALPPQVKAVTGHFDFDVRRHFERPVHAFTILREPVDRLLSLYFYIRREKAHRWHQRAISGDLTLIQCALEQENLQTRFLAGAEAARTLSREELLERAKHNLAEECSAFGLTERFDESIIFFNHTLGWNIRGYTSDNVTPKRPSRERCSEEELAEIKRCNALDLELYAFAQDVFEKRIQADSERIQQELLRLRRRVKFYRHIAACRQFARSLLPWRR